jgi:Helix-turn-helix domain
MTTTNPPRRPSRRIPGRGSATSARNVRSGVGERLRDAREIRGVDLHRVERDTKIRIKYLAALEDGEFSEFPGDVYARGFLRNYATYLGLDADEMEEDWRLEAGAAVPARPTFVGPQPMRMGRRIVFQRAHVVMAMVAVIVLVVGSYFGYQLSRYLSYPTIAVASAGTQGGIHLPIGTTTYVLTGNATPGTTVLISWNGQDAKIIIADDAGHWSYQAVLQPGTNQFDITAKNLDTNHASETTRLLVIVEQPTPTPVLPSIVLTAPLDGASVGATFNVTGTSTLVSTVIVTPTLVGTPLPSGATLPPPTAIPSTSPSAPAGASPGASPGASSSAAAAPQSAKVDALGAFSIPVKLGPGLWQLSIVGTVAKGGTLTKAINRTVSVPYSGLYVLIQVKGGTSTLSYFHDHIADSPDKVLRQDGWSVTVSATTYVCLNPGSPSYVYVTVNGVSYGSINRFGAARVWIDASGPRGVSSCTA